MTSLESLLLINATNEFSLYHAPRSIAPSIKDVKDEYLRLANKHLPIITMDIKWLLNEASAISASRHHAIIIVYVNSKYLAAHAEDISTDLLPLHVDLLTWMDAAVPVNIKKIQLSTQLSCKRRAGGLAAKKWNDFPYI